jgi:hypothetical protein
MESRKCIGFDEFDGVCDNIRGSSHSEMWCQRCDDLRLSHITNQFENIQKFFEKKKEEKQ